MALRFEENADENIVAEINITPLTDIFLVLLIIFMISSSAMLEGGLNVKLPTSKSSSLTDAKEGKPVFVTVSEGGNISVNNQEASESDLVSIIQSELGKTNRRTVVIRGDQNIVLGNAVKVMDAARSAGAEKIAIATQPKQ